MFRSFFALMVCCCVGAAHEPIDVGTRLELLVDDYLIEALRGAASFELHHPVPQEVVLVHDAPWEGSGSGYHTVFADGDKYRMYYKAWNLLVTEEGLDRPHETLACYAESADGIHWEKPDLQLFEFEGSKSNNIVWTGKGSHDFTPFRDPNPGCAPEERYKAIGNGSGPRGAYAFKSADGIHWSPLQEAPILTDGVFDSQNLAFWDAVREEYRAYYRDFRDGVRGIKTATSKDFRDWTSHGWLEYPGATNYQLYTNQVKPYYRAPHLFIGFPTRYIERGWSPSMEALPNPDHRRVRSAAQDRYGMAITDGLLMTSRDGITFKRWDEALLRPGRRNNENWAYGDNYIAWHVLETAPDTLSLYATESYWTQPGSKLRRFTLRVDGFVSVSAPMAGGEIVTKPLVFHGDELVLNFATSAAGSIRIELQEADGTPIPGFTLDDAPPIFGDDTARVAPWKNGGHLAEFAGAAVRLRIQLEDANLYSLQFQ